MGTLTRQRRRGHTLVELVVATAVSMILVAGLGSSMYIASRAATVTLPTDCTLKASDVSLRIGEELRYAVYVIQRSDRSVEFAVDDVNGDGQTDVIRYEWSGTPGDPLMRTQNHGTPKAVAEDLQDFELTYRYRDKIETLDEGLEESGETTLTELTGGAVTSDYPVQSDRWAGQYFWPSLPPDARAWSVTKVELELRSIVFTTGQTRVQLRPATGAGTPTSTVLEEVVLNEWTLGSGYSWKQFPFTNVSGMSPNQGLCIVLEHVSGNTSCEVEYEAGGVALADHGLLESANQGASWLLTSDKGLHFKVKGKYMAPTGTPTEVTRRYMTSVRMSLRIGEGAQSGIQTGIPLLNTPEVLAGFWKLDFDEDPTEADVNYDGQGDWVVRSGDVLSLPLPLEGTWNATETLDTRPKNDFAELTTVEVRFRNTSVGGRGAAFLLNYDFSGNTSHATVNAYVQLQSDGTQTLTVCKKTDNETEAPLVTQSGLSDDFVDLRLVIDPQTDLIAVSVDGASKGIFINLPFSHTNDDRFATIMAEGSDAEYDYVSIRVSDNN